MPELAAASLLGLNATAKQNVCAPSSACAPTRVTERSLIVMGEDGPGDAPVAVPEQELVPLALLFVARQPRAALAGLLSADLFWSLLLSARAYAAAPKGAGGALGEAMVADVATRVLAHLADYAGRHKPQVLASERLSRIPWGQLSPLLDGTALFK